MALLTGTNPECDKPRPLMRFDVRRRWDWFGLRSPIVASIEAGRSFDADRMMVVWAKLPPGLPMDTGDALTLLGSIQTPSDPECIKAKLLALIEADCTAVVFALQRLKDSADEARGDAQVRALKEMVGGLNDSCDRLLRERRDLESQLRLAEQSLSDMLKRGHRPLAITTEDGATVDRGGSVFLGSEPERRLILIDALEALCAETRKVIGLPAGVPVFLKRDHARAWKRSQRTPHLSPVGTGAAQGDPMPNASVGGTTGGESSLGREELFEGPRP